jgi:hypothetical protein
MVVISSLKYLWVQGHHQVSEIGAQLLTMFHPCLHIEVYCSVLGQLGYFLAFYALTKPCTNGPLETKVLVSNPHNH